MKKYPFTVEFFLGGISPRSLWRQISTPAGLESWFAPRVLVEDGEQAFTFVWNKEHQDVADIVAQEEQNFIEYRWRHDEDPNYSVRLSILKDELTGAVILEVRDYATEDDYDSSQLFWESLIPELKVSLGA